MSEALLEAEVATPLFKERLEALLERMETRVHRLRRPDDASRHGARLQAVLSDETKALVTNGTNAGLAPDTRIRDNADFLR